MTPELKTLEARIRELCFECANLGLFEAEGEDDVTHTAVGGDEDEYTWDCPAAEERRQYTALVKEKADGS